MPSGAVAAIAGGTSLVGGLLGAREASSAAGAAAGAQTEASRLGIEEQRRQFDRIQGLLQPYTQAGTGPTPSQLAQGLLREARGEEFGVARGSLQAQQELLGLRGAGAQETAISGLEESPLFQALARQGEEGILQSASATGGLRGGDVQGALAQYRPAMLQGLIESQFQKLGGLTQLGQTSAVGTGAAGQATGTNIANLLAQSGQAQAAGALAQGQARANLFGDIGQLATTGAILKGQGVF